MAASGTSHIDLECGHRGELEEENSVCFSDADDVSCNSQFYSTADGDGSHDDCISEILEECRRSSSVADPCDCVLDVKNCGGNGENKVHLVDVEMDCRICHLSLVSSSPGSGIAIELGCSCKDDLAAAHKNCAETWFKIKGDKTCEICNSIARNVVGPNENIEATQQVSENIAVTETTPSAPVPSFADNRSCLNGHRFLNFLLACMVFAFVISWLFRFNIPS